MPCKTHDISEHLLLLSGVSLARGANVQPLFHTHSCSGSSGSGAEEGTSSACTPPSLWSGRGQISEFICRVLIFSVVFFTKLDTLRGRARPQVQMQPLTMTRTCQRGTANSSSSQTKQNYNDEMYNRHRGTPNKCMNSKVESKGVKYTGLNVNVNAMRKEEVKPPKNRLHFFF